MKTYHCACHQVIFFENSSCINCRRELGFLPDLLRLTSLEPTKKGLFRPVSKEIKSHLYRKCRNYGREVVCNWMVDAESESEYCASCQLDEIIPNLTIPRNVELWKLIERAKRRLIYTLISLKLPLLNRQQDPKQGLAFRFMADGPTPETKIMTGHAQGIITLNIAEADDSERERRRLSLREPYRTLLGHFRHESGHYYWDRLIRDTKYLQPFRKIFGDEQTDYDQALKKYYASSGSDHWQDRYISVYATSHPWEDWAETWAHYLHIQDTLEVAITFGLADKHFTLKADEIETKPSYFSQPKTFNEKIEAWAALSIALNSLNRSMGLKDIYPFVLSSPVVEKLRFVSEVVSDRDIKTVRTPTSLPVPHFHPGATGRKQKAESVGV